MSSVGNLDPRLVVHRRRPRRIRRHRRHHPCRPGRRPIPSSFLPNLRNRKD